MRIAFFMNVKEILFRCTQKIQSILVWPGTTLSRKKLRQLLNIMNDRILEMRHSHCRTKYITSFWTKWEEEIAITQHSHVPDDSENVACQLFVFSLRMHRTFAAVLGKYKIQDMSQRNHRI